MSLLTIILASLAAQEHLYIFYLESIRTTSDTTSRVFNMDKEELARPSVTSLFKNQGIYNALIGVFLLYGLFVSKNSEIVTIFVLFIIGAAARSGARRSAGGVRIVALDLLNTIADQIHFHRRKTCSPVQDGIEHHPEPIILHEYKSTMSAR